MGGLIAMLALAVEEADVKDFMNKLLRESVFDDFELRSARVSSFALFQIDGPPDPPEDETRPAEREPLTWGRLRPYVFNIVKGAAKPSSMRLVLAADGETLAAVSAEAASLFINISFENGAVVITSGFSPKSFSLDKSAERLCDVYAADFLRENGIRAVSL
jgi:hypothetical protein